MNNVDIHIHVSKRGCEKLLLVKFIILINILKLYTYPNIEMPYTIVIKS